MTMKELAERRAANGRLRTVPLKLRFWAKVDKLGLDECWLWKGCIGAKGYGQISDAAGKLRGAHRVAYELAGGSIPSGMQLDHLCRNRACVNPAHLEPVTPAENTRRGLAGHHRRVEAALITSCPQGHPYDERNTYVTKAGKRQCKACAIARQNARRAAMKEAGIVRTA